MKSIIVFGLNWLVYSCSVDVVVPIYFQVVPESKPPPSLLPGKMYKEVRAYMCIYGVSVMVQIPFGKVFCGRDGAEGKMLKDFLAGCQGCN